MSGVSNGGKRLPPEYLEMEAALTRIARKQQEALAMVRDNGFVFVDIGAEPGNWQHLAFSLYNDICEIDCVARAGLGLEVGDDLDGL